MADDGSETDENMPSANDDENDSDYEAPNEKLTVKAKRIRRSNGKWKLFNDSKRQRKEWQELYPWAEEDPRDPKFVKCCACNKRMKASRAIFETHQKTKKHIKNLSGSDDIEEEDDDNNKKNEKSEPKSHAAPPMQAQAMQPQQIDQMLNDDQINFFTESPIDAAHQAITNLIDKLVEKYHENRLENLKIQNEAMLQLNVERANLIRAENQRKLDRRVQQEQNMRETQDINLKYMQQQHEVKISALEDERDAKLKAVEQELMLARQEYEKKMKLLDCQLSIMK